MGLLLQDAGLCYRRMLLQGGDYLAKLDAKAAYLDLLVRSPYKNDIAIGKVPAEIAGLEHPVACRVANGPEGVGDVQACCQAGIIPVTAREIRAADMNLAQLANACLYSGCGLDDELRAVYAAAQWHEWYERHGRVWRGRAPCHRLRRFRRAVEVYYLHIRGVWPQGRDEGAIEHVAAKEKVAQ